MTETTDWNPEQYLRFAEPRLRPALDLLQRIELDSPEQIADLGCGAGNVTAWLARRWPRAHVIGVDDSPAMIERARTALPHAQWHCTGIARWRPDEPVELIFSNAALHWLGDHARLLPALLRLLKPGGVLAVQMPANFHAPSHTAMAETVHAGPWRDRLRPLLGDVPVAEPERYFEWLAPHAAQLDVWRTEYLQVLTGPDPVKEWTKGTWLKRFLEVLPAAEAAAFEADYAARVRQAYPPLPDGRTLFPFRRLFIVARRPR